MDSPYIYIPAPDYINNLLFDYIETYSFQRGNDYENAIKIMKPEYDRLKVRNEKRSDIGIEEKQRFQELDQLFGFTQYLINAEGKFHFSAIKTNTFRRKDRQIDNLKQILNTEVKEVPMFLCAPEYRDAIVFFNEDKQIVSSLNVCLSCAYMEIKIFHHINGDWETYDLLKRFFINCGHQVEEPDKFFMDTINAMKQKYLNNIASKNRG